MSNQKDGGPAFPHSHMGIGAQTMSDQDDTTKLMWVTELMRTKETLSLLRGSIRGNSPSQKQMSDRLLDAINIVSTQITVEQQLIK